MINGKLLINRKYPIRKFSDTSSKRLSPSGGYLSGYHAPTASTSTHHFTSVSAKCVLI